MPFKKQLDHIRPLFEGYQEIHTIYFRSSMSKANWEPFNTRKHPRAGQLAFTPQNIRKSRWSRLYGFRHFNGQGAVAALIVFDWKCPRTKKPIPAEAFEIELQEAGCIGYESIHCDFIGGCWRTSVPRVDV